MIALIGLVFGFWDCSSAPVVACIIKLHLQASEETIAAVIQSPRPAMFQEEAGHLFVYILMNAAQMQYLA